MSKKFLYITISIVILLIVGIVLLSTNHQSIQKVNGNEARQILQDNANNSIFIDVRTTAEHQVNGISGSINIPYDQIGSLITNYVTDKNTKIIVYCNTGNRSSQAAQTLKSLGYNYIYDMGSYENW